MSHLRHRKPARIHWKADAPKTSKCLVRLLVQRHNWAIFLRKRARRSHYSKWQSLSGHVERIFDNKNWRGGYWQHFVSTGRRFGSHSRSYTLYFAPCFWRSHLLAKKLMSFGHLGAANWHRWTIICGVPPKINVTPTSQRQLTLYNHLSWWSSLKFTWDMQYRAVLCWHLYILLQNYTNGLCLC